MPACKMCGFPHIIGDIVRIFAPSVRAAWRRVWLIGLVLLALAALLVWAGGRWSLAQAEAVADATARQTARTHVALLSS